MEVNQIFYLKKGCVHVCIALIAAGPRVDQREQLLPRDRVYINCNSIQYRTSASVLSLGDCFFFIDQCLSPYLQYFIHLTTAHQKCPVKLLPTSIENCFQQIFNLFQFQCGPSFLFIPWSACWAILHLIGLGLQPYFHKDNELDLKWFSYLTYWGYTSLALFTAWDCAAAVYVHIRRQDIVKNGEDPQQPRTTLEF